MPQVTALFSLSLALALTLTLLLSIQPIHASAHAHAHAHSLGQSHGHSHHRRLGSPHHRIPRRSSKHCPSKAHVTSNQVASPAIELAQATSTSTSMSTSSNSHRHHYHHSSEESSGSFDSSSTSSPSASSSTSASKSSPKTASSSSASSASPSASATSSGHGLMGFVDPTCGPSDATQDTSKMSGPNGSMDFLNCGLYSSSGWTPPAVTLDMVTTVALDEALEDDQSVFQACKPYLSIFEKYAAQLDLPPILLASIAMQESSCEANQMGDDGGAYGLMQITQDKCTDGISCTDPDYNVKTGAAYFKSVLDQYNGNVLLAMGSYNGWYTGLTVPKATAVKSSCCECQNNLNYLQQMLNGWMQGQDGNALGDFDMGC